MRPSGLGHAARLGRSARKLGADFFEHAADANGNPLRVGARRRRRSLGGLHGAGYQHIRTGLRPSAGPGNEYFCSPRRPAVRRGAWRTDAVALGRSPRFSFARRSASASTVVLESADTYFSFLTVG